MMYRALLFLMVLLPCAGSQAQTAQPETLQSAERTFTLTLHADPDRALRAFGPIEEKQWSPEWDPKVISSEGDPSDPDFAVFRITHGRSESVWTLSHHDRQRGTLQYVVFNPGNMITVIDIHCTAAGQQVTHTTVTYRKTALAAESNSQISHFAQHFTQEREHWEQAIDKYLQASKSPR